LRFWPNQTAHIAMYRRLVARISTAPVQGTGAVLTGLLNNRRDFPVSLFGLERTLQDLFCGPRPPLWFWPNQTAHIAMYRRLVARISTAPVQGTGAVPACSIIAETFLFRCLAWKEHYRTSSTSKVPLLWFWPNQTAHNVMYHRLFTRISTAPVQGTGAVPACSIIAETFLFRCLAWRGHCSTSSVDQGPLLRFWPNQTAHIVMYHRRRRVLAGTPTKKWQRVAAKIWPGLAPGQIFAARPPRIFVCLPQ
jgi:hypothetical protein